MLFLSAFMTLSAATKQEMEQARALTAKWGVRSQNAGSGYLDGTNPKNMSQLQASVKSHSKDNENLGKLHLSMPSEEEYASWDNAKMTAYWVAQYNKAVPAGGDKNYCLSKLKSSLSGVTATVSAAENKTAETETPEETPEETPVAEEVTDTIEAPEETEGLAEDAMNGEAQPEMEMPAQVGAESEHAAAEGNHPLATEGSNTWVIIMLILLVIAVLVLVGYASNLMARNKREEGNKDSDNQDKSAADSELSRRVEREMLSRVNDDDRTSAPVAPVAAPATHKPAPRISQPRVIYLSQANSEGVFLRADARYNPGNSIFKLVTTDGYSGTYSVIDDSEVHNLALMMPTDFLINACSGRNLQLSHGATGIVTDSTGTAVFEDGRWRVARKAQIHYTA